jgi:hypothetical protein
MSSSPNRAAVSSANDAHAGDAAEGRELADAKGRDEAGHRLADAGVAVGRVGRIELVGVADPVELVGRLDVVEELEVEVAGDCVRKGSRAEDSIGTGGKGGQWIGWRCASPGRRAAGDDGRVGAPPKTDLTLSWVRLGDGWQPAKGSGQSVIEVDGRAVPSAVADGPGEDVVADGDEVRHGGGLVQR